MWFLGIILEIRTVSVNFELLLILAVTMVVYIEEKLLDSMSIALVF
jgi:hypothetical protein